MIIENMDEQEKKEALLEAKILEKLDHQNIIKFREVFMARKPVFTLNIVMDFADGNIYIKIKVVICNQKLENKKVNIFLKNK
jgi:NIMA (never in mitosis gene a)-related kinase